MYKLSVKAFLIVLFSFYFLPHLSIAQSKIKKLEELLSRDQLEEIQELLPKVEQQYPDHPTVLYLKGIFEKDATAAFQCFQRVMEKYKDSIYADDALYRIAQYFYAQGKFDLAQKYFSLLTRRYSYSPLKDDAQYLLCQCMIAKGKVDSAKIFLNAFIKNSPRSPFVDLAVMDLESFNSMISDEPAAGKEAGHAVFKYVIQVGAFSSRKNADQFAEKFKQEGHTVDIVAKKIGRKKWYAVWVGRFQTKAMATNYAEKLLKKSVNDYKIIDRSKF